MSSRICGVVLIFVALSISAAAGEYSDRVKNLASVIPLPPDSASCDLWLWDFDWAAEELQQSISPLAPLVGVAGLSGAESTIFDPHSGALFYDGRGRTLKNFTKTNIDRAEAREIIQRLRQSQNPELASEMRRRCLLQGECACLRKGRSPSTAIAQVVGDDFGNIDVLMMEHVKKSLQTMPEGLLTDTQRKTMKEELIKLLGEETSPVVLERLVKAAVKAIDAQKAEISKTVAVELTKSPEFRSHVRKLVTETMRCQRTPKPSGCP